MKILIENKRKEAKSYITSGTNPHQTKNQQEFLDREGSPDSPPPLPDNTTQHGNNEKTETTILLAARNGITEMVEYILNKFPMAIDNKSEGQNIVLLAVKNRQTHVLQLLLEQEFVKRKLIHEVDTDENNALHLAAQIGKQRPWLIPGAALQMQWEIMWYEV